MDDVLPDSSNHDIYIQMCAISSRVRGGLSEWKIEAKGVEQLALSPGSGHTALLEVILLVGMGHHNCILCLLFNLKLMPHNYKMDPKC